MIVMRMKNNMRSSISLSLIFFFFIFSFSLIISSHGVNGYTNYTVGDSFGWYDVLENPKIDYHNWTAGKNFSLGDFLIFNTDTNHSVIQTYNFTTYKLCDYDNALDNDTVQWSSADPSNTATRSITVAVPLLKVGPTYFFSGDYDGEQCLNGQRFQVNVTHGQGLPPSLIPDDGSPGPVGPQSGDDDIQTPYNFDNPKDDTGDSDDEDKPSNSPSLLAFSKMFGVQSHGLIILVGFFILCF